MHTLIQHHTTHGVRYGVVIKRGRKWMTVWYVGYPRPTKLSLLEERYMTEKGKLTNRQRARFNQSVRRAGGKRGALS